ncbi:MAG: hypothetical protein PHH26_08965 [Candidatus Thermoplasmatota archaeon]|nr:hypothetical protein [Candidatus Thermoplasmatota archaeon]
MFALRQIIEDPQDFIPVPPELRHRKTEVIFIAIDQPGETGQAQGIKDGAIAEFFGCLPDFPDREPQGDYETRRALD